MAAAAHSKDRLLVAGAALFAERGFSSTTTRDVAKRAGVDAALIVRYFGSKVGLYLACLNADDDGSPTHLLQTDRMLSVINRVDTDGSGPIFQAAVQAHPDDDVRAATMAALHSRVVEPLRQYFVGAGDDRPQFKAELVAAAFAGLALGRSGGAFPELAAAAPAEIVAMMQQAFSRWETDRHTGEQLAVDPIEANI